MKKTTKIIFLTLFILQLALFQFPQKIEASIEASSGDSIAKEETGSLTFETLESTFSHISYTFNSETFTPKDYPAELSLKDGIEAKIEFQNKKLQAL